jgi:DNA-binding PadR family transcriptional regulator
MHTFFYLVWVIMYPYYFLPKPLPINEFYVLLALAHEPMYAYGIKSAAHKFSLGSVEMATGKLYPLLTRMLEDGLVQTDGERAAGRMGKPRLHYKISEIGRIRLQEEAQRLQHALGVMASAGLLEPEELPADIRRALLLVRGKAL